jgi:hypothetical protein
MSAPLTNEKYLCIRKIWDGPLYYRCGRPAKYYIESGGIVPIPLCGIHARHETREKKPIAELANKTALTEVAKP